MMLRTSNSFRSKSDAHLNFFALAVIEAMTGNTHFPTPPITLAALTTLQETFAEKIMAALNAGPMETAEKNAARAALLLALRNYASYVQIQSANDMAVLLSSGFEPVSTNRVSLPLPQPTAPVVKNGNTTELIVSVTSVPNARSYETRFKPEDGVNWQQSVFTTGSRNITLSGLTPGQAYTVEVRAVGGATGLSPWSDPTTRISV